VKPKKPCHIGATWQIQLKDPRLAVMQPFCHISLTTCCSGQHSAPTLSSVVGEKSNSKAAANSPRKPSQKSAVGRASDDVTGKIYTYVLRSLYAIELLTSYIDLCVFYYVMWLMCSSMCYCLLQLLCINPDSSVAL